MLPAMMSLRDLDIGRLLQAAESESPVNAAAAVARELGAAFGASAGSFLISDLTGRSLVRLAHVPLSDTEDAPPLHGGERRDHEESATDLPFDGGPEEQAVRTQQVQVVPSEAGDDGSSGSWRVLAPVTERGESIGLLELSLPEEPSDETAAEIAQVAHLLAFVVIANQRHTDLFEWGQRSRSFSLSAEIQQRLLPGPRTCEAASFTLSGWLEPASDIGGDTFDYCLDRNVLHLSLTDAMGHGVDSALTASVCLGSLRGSRRLGHSLVEQATEANQALAARAKPHGLEDFVTGLLARIDLRTGTVEIVNAGHVAPFLVRDGKVMALDLPVDLPFGLFADTDYRSSSANLEPGDRIVMVTDGMLEHHIGNIHLSDVIASSGELHPRELVRALADTALDATGHQLGDDATVLCLDWYGTHDQERSSTAGADQDIASARLP